MRVNDIYCHIICEMEANLKTEEFSLFTVAVLTIGQRDGIQRHGILALIFPDRIKRRPVN